MSESALAHLCEYGDRGEEGTEHAHGQGPPCAGKGTSPGNSAAPWSLAHISSSCLLYGDHTLLSEVIAVRCVRVRMPFH